MFNLRFWGKLPFILILMLPLYSLYTMLVADSRYPQAREGVLDLRGWDFAKDGAVPLSGEWTFYRNQLLVPDQGTENSAQGTNGPLGIQTVVPGVWNSYVGEDGQRESKGYGTYRLRVLLDAEQGQTFGVKTSNIRTAHRMFVGSEEVGAEGKPGDSAKTSVASNTPYAAYMHVEGVEAELLVQVANYSYSTGGIIYPIWFGDQRSIQEVREGRLVFDFVASAGFLIPGLFFLFLYGLRREEKSVLHLALFCLSGLVYVLTHGEKLLGWSFPSISYGMFLRIQLGSSILSHYFLLRYVTVTVKSKPPAWMGWLFGPPVLIGLLTMIFLPVLFFTKLDYFYYFYSLLVVVYVGYALFQDMRKRAQDMVYLLMSVQSVVVMIAVSILHVVGLLPDQSLIAVEMLVFVIAQALLLARRFAESFRKVEHLSRRLLTLDGLKNEFMANTSHELRTPLHGIVNIAESLLAGAGGQLNTKQASDLSMIASTGKRLSALINDILDFSRLKNGDIVLNRQPVELRSTVTSVLEVVAYLTGSRNVRLVCNVSDALPLLDTDENRLQQMLYNLLGNAVKFTQQGEIRVSAEARGSMVMIHVSDTGIGIAPERLPHLFQAFDDPGVPLDTDQIGTGLGLSITKKLVKLNGGSIRVQSEPGRGSVFSFTLPTWRERNEVTTRGAGGQGEAVEPSSVRPAAIAPVEGKHRHAPEFTVLVVDDDLVNLQVLYNLLSVDNYAVLIADNGPDALKYLDGGAPPDCVITDWMMPGMSGLELCRTIRERYTLSELPVLMLTARSRPEDVQTGFQAGVNDYLSKPVNAAELRARVRTLLTLRRSAQTAVRTESALLQAQIKPHFLYNALNTIIAMCPIDPELTMRLLTELSRYLRASFDFANRDKLTPLYKEIELVKAYLSLEKARFDDRLQVEYDIEGDMNSVLPPLSIQPIVENAVRHGLMRKASGGTVRITVREKDGRIRVIVTDDGVGMSAERRSEVLDERTVGGIGLRNIHKRLLALYGRGLQLESEWQRGTTVCFEIPLNTPAA